MNMLPPLLVVSVTMPRGLICRKLREASTEILEIKIAEPDLRSWTEHVIGCLDESQELDVIT